MNKKRRNNIVNNLYKFTAIEVYEFLLRDEISRFPPGFVTRDNMKEIIREVILNRQKLTRNEICKKLTYDYLIQYRLRGSRRAFDSNLYKLMTYCFPEMNIKYWELNKVEDGFWLEEKNRREYMKWLIQKENIDPSKITDLSKISSSLIDRNHGRRAREYGGGVYNLVLLIAEVDVKEWQVINVAHWDDEKASCAIKWLLKEKLNWSYEEIATNITPQVFYNYGLGGLFSNYFKNNMIKALNHVYPAKFKRVSNNKIQVVQ